MTRVLSWNAGRQSYSPKGVGDTIEPTEGHWAYFAEAQAPFFRTCVADGWRFAYARTEKNGCPVSMIAEDVPLQSFGFQLEPSEVKENYKRATLLRDDLLRTKRDPDTQQVWTYQVEYLPDEIDSRSNEESNHLRDSTRLETPQSRDSKHLASFERVWAYTQGIALAQLARKHQQYGDEALGLARYLCHHAVQDLGKTRILGWPFSWNTAGDDWKDARLVTGANAWVVQGLGAFIASEAFLASAREDQETIRTCYQKALVGLEDHRYVLKTPAGLDAVLMSAGWTTVGLQRVDNPGAIRTDEGSVLSNEPGERWAYYSVLDALGYEDFSPTFVRSCRPTANTDCWSVSPTHPSYRERVISEAEWRALKRRTKALNVVTEHNIDMLSVLNDALDHSDRLGPSDPAERSLWAQNLQKWRDDVREGIFFFLWDHEGWKQEFHQVVADSVPDHTETVVQQSEYGRRADRMGAALASGQLGRIITGGTLHTRAEGTRFVPSPHTAVDNCSWLALAVDYVDLAQAGGHNGGSIPYTDRVAQCLEYTVLRFVKDLRVKTERCERDNESCLAPKTYRGAHYFQNAFHDPYIAPSEMQESSYHVEATMGLIQGLYRFASVHPEHPRAEILLEDARGLWAGAQHFVRDHGFVYSSQRIQDLSARMVSSTAIIWFIDVHDAIEDLVEDPDDVSQAEIIALGPRNILVNGKARTKAMQAVVRLVDDLLGVPAPLAAAAMSSMVAAGHLSSGFTEIDPGLETLFLGGDAPDLRHWEPAGFVMAHDLIAQPLGTYVIDETEIRARVALYRAPPSAEGQQSPSTHFADERIYYIEIDRLGFDDSPAGGVRFLLPDANAKWSVYALKTPYPREELLKAFVEQHPRYQRSVAAVAWLPETLQALWLSMVEITVRAEFDRAAAEALRVDVFSEHALAHTATLPEGPLQAFLAEGVTLPPWIYELPPEFIWPVYYATFILPTHADGHAPPRNTILVTEDPPSTFEWWGENGVVLRRQAPWSATSLAESGHIQASLQFPTGPRWHVSGLPSAVEEYLAKHKARPLPAYEADSGAALVPLLPPPPPPPSIAPAGAVEEATAGTLGASSTGATADVVVAVIDWDWAAFRKRSFGELLRFRENHGDSTQKVVEMEIKRYTELLGLSSGLAVLPIDGGEALDDDSGLADQALAMAIDKAVEMQKTMPIRVIDVSYSGDLVNPEMNWSYMVDEAIENAKKAGIAIFFSAGNGGHKSIPNANSHVGAKATNVAIVGGAQSASFSSIAPRWQGSNWGPAVNFLAPSSVVTQRGTEASPLLVTPLPGGTSYSAAKSSALGAILYAVSEQEGYRPTAEEVLGTMERTLVHQSEPPKGRRLGTVGPFAAVDLIGNAAKEAAASLDPERTFSAHVAANEGDAIAALSKDTGAFWVGSAVVRHWPAMGDVTVVRGNRVVGVVSEDVLEGLIRGGRLSVSQEPMYSDAVSRPAYPVHLHYEATRTPDTPELDPYDSRMPPSRFVETDVSVEDTLLQQGDPTLWFSIDRFVLNTAGLALAWLDERSPAPSSLSGGRLEKFMAMLEHSSAVLHFLQERDHTAKFYEVDREAWDAYQPGASHLSRGCSYGVRPKAGTICTGFRFSACSG